jgi:hypothetical protein
MKEKKFKILKYYKTFREWSNEGYSINKGSKATWVNNIPKFSRSQVTKRFSNSRRYSIWENYDPRDGDADFENGYSDEEMGFDINDFGDN